MKLQTGGHSWATDSLQMTHGAVVSSSNWQLSFREVPQLNDQISLESQFVFFTLGDAQLFSGLTSNISTIGFNVKF